MYGHDKVGSNMAQAVMDSRVGTMPSIERGLVAESLVTLHHRIEMLRERQRSLIDRLNPALRPDLPVFTPPREQAKVSQPKSQFTLTVEEASLQILDLVEQTENLMQALEL